jgi:RecA/RadA recombinase
MRVSLGWTDLDRLVGGGVEEGSIIEVLSELGSIASSQILVHICSTLIINR